MVILLIRETQGLALLNFYHSPKHRKGLGSTVTSTILLFEALTNDVIAWVAFLLNSKCITFL